MSGVKTVDRSPLFPLLQIDIEKYRGRWRIFVGDYRFKKTYQTKIQAIRAARAIRRSFSDSGVFGELEQIVQRVLDCDTAA